MVHDCILSLKLLLLACALETWMKCNETNIQNVGGNKYHSISSLFMISMLENIIVFILVIPVQFMLGLVKRSYPPNHNETPHNDDTVSKLFLAQVLPSLFYSFTCIIQSIWENDEYQHNTDRINTIRILSLLFTCLFRWVAYQVILERQMISLSLLVDNGNLTFFVYIFGGICALTPLFVDYSCFFYLFTCFHI